MSAFRRRAWLLAPAFALHVAEEAPGFTAWARRHASDRYTQRDFVRNNALGMAGTVAGLWVLRRTRSHGYVLFFSSVLLTQQALWNTAFHAGTTVAWRRYSPGLVTALALFLPLWLHLVRLARREGLLSRGELTAGTIAGGLLHALVVAQQVFFVGVARR